MNTHTVNTAEATFHLSPFTFHLIMVVCLLASCEKPDLPTVEPTATGFDPGVRALVLNEGVWGGNNASLMRYDGGKIDGNWFATANARGLGEVAQDLLLYGSRAYVSVWGSSSLEVVDTVTGISRHVSLGDRYPRYLTADGGKLYVTCYNPHSVVRIDTATLAVEATCLLGNYNPEGIAALGGRLFVASDNIADASGTYHYDSLLYVIDVATFTLADSVVVGVNPQQVLVVDSVHLVVNHWGAWDLDTYGTVGEGAAIVDVRDLGVRPIGRLLSNMTVADGIVYGYEQTYANDGSTRTAYFTVDPHTLAVAPLPIAASALPASPYAIAVDEATGHIYIASDGNRTANGTLHVYAADGTPLGSVAAGMLPSKVVFL